MRQSNDIDIMLGVLLVHSRVIFRGYLSEDLVSEDDNRGKLLGCVLVELT